MADEHAGQTAELPLKVWSDGQTWVVARGVDHAKGILESMMGEPVSGIQDYDGGAWEELPDDKVLKVRMDDGRGDVFATCALWISTNGAGVLASVDF